MRYLILISYTPSSPSHHHIGHPSLTLQALNGNPCKCNARGLINPQNVTTPKTTHKIFTI
jgi:hypothetical protein